jgi:hypothetical protein
MILDLQRPLTTREYEDIFLQISIQWGLGQSLPTTDAPLKAPFTDITVSSGTSKAHVWDFSLSGCDAFGNQYSRTFHIDLEEEEDAGDKSYIKFVPTDQDSYMVGQQIFYVQKRIATNINENDYRYVIIQDVGIYMVINITALLQYGENLNISTSVYEFNVMFPVTGKSEIMVTHLNDNKQSVTKSISELVLKNSGDVTWIEKQGNITAMTPPPSIVTFEDKPYLKYINGIEMTSNAVSVTFYTSPEVPNTPPAKLTGGSGGVIGLVGIPATGGAEGPDKLPYKFAGVGKNSKIFETYSFSMTEPKWVAATEKSDAGSGVNYYEQCNASWVDRATDEGAEASTPYTGIADLKLKVDGNVPMLPVLPANTITDMPEYRLFNPHFVSEDLINTLTGSIRFQRATAQRVKETSEIRSPGYFTIASRRGSRKKFCVCDSATANVNYTKSGKSSCIVKKDYKTAIYNIPYESYSASEGKKYIWLSCECKQSASSANVKLRVTKEHPINMADYDGTKEYNKYILIGTAQKGKKQLLISQERNGMLVFDYDAQGSGSMEYDGPFAIKAETGDKGEILGWTVKGGQIRVINRSYQVEALTFTIPGIVYIHVTMDVKNGQVTAVLEIADKLPQDDDTNSYFQVAHIVGVKEDKQTTTKGYQDYYGGTPLFLFFSTDCVETEEEEEE